MPLGHTRICGLIDPNVYRSLCGAETRTNVSLKRINLDELGLKSLHKGDFVQYYALI